MHGQARADEFGDYKFEYVIMCKIKVEMGRACSTNGDKRNAYWILVGKPEGKRPLGRPRRRCMDNIKMDLREMGWDGMD
jgi:hypothetical protein